MEAQRIREIIESIGYTNVIYKGNPVLIQSIDEESKTANVKYMNAKELISVPITELRES